MQEFDIRPDNEPERPDEDILDTENVIVDVIKHSRSKQVLNEEQTVLTLLNYITGLLPDKADFGAVVITGGTASGKTHMKEKVVEDLFKYKWADWAYTTTSTSAKAIIDDEGWDEARFAALDEMNKIPKEMMELLKSTYADDSGFGYSRNKPDQQAKGGFTPVKLERDPLPVIFMLADENDFSVEAELGSRFMEVKVDETEEKNASVHDVKWGHSRVKMDNSEVEYYQDESETTEALRWHIADIPVDTGVVIPTGEGRFEGDDVDFAAVAKPLFNFKKNESTRASRLVASLVKASALLNYHSRPTVEIDGEMKFVAQPEDLANILICRKSLLVTTHDLSEKKMAVLDAIIEKGGQANSEGTKLHATLEDIEDYIQNQADIARIGKNDLRDILNEMDNDYIIDITDNPEDRRENLYVYGGADSLGEPNIWDYYEHFADITDPIRDQPLEETIKQQQKALGKSSPKDVLEKELTLEDAMGSGPDDQAKLVDEPEELSELESAVLDGLHDTLDGVTMTWEEAEEMDFEHMLGVTERGDVPTTADIDSTVFDPHSKWWDGDKNRGDVKSEVSDVIARLKRRGLWQMDDEGDEVTISVESP